MNSPETRQAHFRALLSEALRRCARAIDWEAMMAGRRGEPSPANLPCIVTALQRLSILVDGITWDLERLPWVEALAHELRSTAGWLDRCLTADEVRDEPAWLRLQDIAGYLRDLLEMVDGVVARSKEPAPRGVRGLA